mgnify:CR=1 FL=1|jgi:hypothetical protein
MNQLSIFPAAQEIAIFSPCRQYRYTLWRRWGDDWESNFCMFIALNPSTADEVQDDPTVRRCIRYAKSWGYSALCMTNIFAYRATDPNVMKAQAEPIGEENDRYLIECAAKAKIVVAAWGNHGVYRDRHRQVTAMIPDLHCLKITGAGMPSHPLYLPKNLEPFRL